MKMTDSKHNQLHPFSKLAKRLDSDTEQYWHVHEQALTMKQQGQDVVMLSIGDPDFRTPEPIIDNAVSHMRVGRTHYSPSLGELNLRRAVADYETKTSPHPCSTEEVSIYPGVTSALFSVMSCLLNADDEIIIVDPWYVGYKPIMKALDVDVKTIAATADNGFIPQLNDFKAAISQATKVVLINTPGNPTGAIIPTDTLRELADYCLQRGIWLVCDEVYSMFTYEQRHVSLRTAANALDNVVVIDGLSKSHAMSGWRVGWVVAPLTLTKHLGHFAAMSMFGSPQFIQDAAAFALNNDEYYVQEMRTEYQARRDLVCAHLDTISSITYQCPQSGVFIMIDVSAIYPDDKTFAQQLLTAEKVSVLPGSGFGNSTRGHIRFSLMQPQHILAEGCKRLKRFAQSAQAITAIQ